MYASSPSQTPDATPRIGEWFSESFNLFSREWVTWVLQGLIYMALVSIPIIPGAIAYYGSFFQMMANTGPNSTTPPNPAPLLLGMGALYGGSCIGAIIGLYLLIGMSRTAMKQIRGEAIAVGDLFGGMDVFLPVVGAYFLAVLGVYAGLLLCVVPGLLLMGLWIFVHPLIVERRMGVMEAFRTSWEVTKPHMWSYVGWGILIAVIYGVGGSTGCGMIATLPLAIIMMMVSYRDVFERPAGFTPSPTNGPMAPPIYYGPAGPPSVGGACPGCGRLVAAGAVVCPNCGTPVSGGPGGPPPTQSV